MMYELIASLSDGQGATLHNYKAISYKTGYQVADTGVECTTIMEVLATIANYKGTCGIWYSDGIYYVDHSFRVKTKREALTIGKAHNQISVLKWSDMSLVYC